MVKKIDCRNLACPEPVLKTKEALEEMEEGILEVKLNSFSSIQNVKRFAKNQGLYISEKKDGKDTIISIVKGYECEIPYKQTNESKSFWTLIIGAVITAFLASTCCLGPLLFLIFGISVGSLSFLHIFAPYHIYFSIAAVLIILYLWGNWFFKLRKKPVCEGSICKNYVKYLTIGTIFVAILVTYPYWAQYILIGE
ncbi:mercury transporter MerT [Caminibacter mediatlanticus TB-2]|uniref:Mercuric transport protein MerT n=1 Tax=Caminibacter mediatlanticus TB-2 TaxID=391592 RepID=A0ABX5VC59_9BACT|nr:mercuric transporter MerT family protein [Caminibacter mediatlanticus]QCT95217.1 mercury transporter MerT [Caminibacter mediatlanticus TB-2]